MSVRSLVTGLIVLLVLLVAAGLIGGIGSVELLIWLALVAAWIAGWFATRGRHRPAP
jgi:hypothetical protein